MPIAIGTFGRSFLPEKNSVSSFKISISIGAKKS
jgi:hypothetical protein